MKPDLRILLLMPVLLLGACTPLAEGAQQSAQSLGEARDDVGTTMHDLFTYHPKPKTPKPAQTRYCYQFASDIVCYDQPQPQLTSKIMGVQGSEGPRMIVQPTPVDPNLTMVTPVDVEPVAPPVGAPVDTSMPVDSQATVGTVSSPASVESHDLPPGTPFHSKESPYVKPAAK